MPTTTHIPATPATPELDRERWTTSDGRATDTPATPGRASVARPEPPDRFGQFGHDNTFLRHTKPASRRPR